MLQDKLLFGTLLVFLYIYPLNEPITGPIVDNNEKSKTNTPSFIKPYFFQKNTFRKGKIINTIIIPRNICKNIPPNATIGSSMEIINDDIISVANKFL